MWDSHVAVDRGNGRALLYVDRQLLHEVSTPQAFEALRASGRRFRRPETHLAVADHAVPTRSRSTPIADPLARDQVARLEHNAAAFGVKYLALDSVGQGIVHVVGPERGFTLPGITMVCGDSHTTTHGAFGALAFGIGATECGTVMATQCLAQRRAKTMLVDVHGALAPGVTTKDLSLAFIAMIGAQGAAGYAVEYGGPGIAALSMAARMTLCNMTIEAGGRVGLIAPDDVTFAWLKGREMAPAAAAWDAAVAYWRTLPSDPGAAYDQTVRINLADIAPWVTWGTSPEDGAPITGRVPDPAAFADAGNRRRVADALIYMGLAPGTRLADVAIDRVFIGSCTNGRIEDLRAAAAVVVGRHIHCRVTGIVVPGSTATRHQAETEGLDEIFRAAGFEWRHAGCSMCVAMNDDRLAPGERCAATSNRNFEGRQGQGGRTHLMSPAMAAGAAVAGHLVDIREMTRDLVE